MDPNKPPPYQAEPDTPLPQSQYNSDVTVVQPVYGTLPIVFSDVPVTFTDSHGNQVRTELEYRAGALTWIIALVIFFLGLGFFFPLFCVCIPCCIKSTKDVYHINPNDGSVVGIYRRLG